MKILRGILAVVLGLVVGGVVNMGLIVLGQSVIAPPAGVNVNEIESIRASIHLFEPKHFFFPFLAHALGTLSGAIVAYAVASSYRSVFSYVVGVTTLAGGIAAAFMIPAPAWFIGLDLVVAYIPMAWLGTLIGRRILKTS
jgi:hypothetical protein